MATAFAVHRRQVHRVTQPGGDPTRTLEERRLLAQELDPGLLLALRRRRLVGKHGQQPYLAALFQQVGHQVPGLDHGAARTLTHSSQHAVDAFATGRLVGRGQRFVEFIGTPQQEPFPVGVVR